MIDLILYPLLLSLPLAILVGPVGAILVWRKSSFLSDVVAHMGILAFALSKLMHLPILLVSVSLSVIIACVLEWAPSFLSKDAWLSGLSSLGIAIGLIFLGNVGEEQNFAHIFWGDIFSLTSTDIFVFTFAAGFLGMHLIVFWKSLILTIFHEQLAVLDGVPVRFIKFITNIIAGVGIALCLNVMGVLLTSALFVLPSVGLRFLRISPEKHIGGTMIVILLSFVFGLWMTLFLDVLFAPWVIIALIFLNFTIFFIKKGIDSYGEK
jgi:zinc transport system permease protein